ncbi:MAG: MBL fold metallo-hydrolase [Candidatus Methylopumilus sp.]|nr:MBL fold metallo-hydrolase [Candidatus Methylopumilus sp.]
MSNHLHIEAFFDSNTSTFSYLLMDELSKEAAIIDSVLDYDPKSGRTNTQAADNLLARIAEQGATLRWVLETHVHADHLSAAPYLIQSSGGQSVIGAQIVQVQKVFAKLFNLSDEFQRDGSQFNRLIHDGDELQLGQFKISAIHTPGHTPACMTYLIDDGNNLHAFVGDTLFMPDYGTARCDFPGGSANELYGSIQKVLALPENTRLYMCHDYPPASRSAEYLSLVKEQKLKNIHVHNGIGCHEFVAMREKRDATLSMPILLLPAVQVNMRAGHFPPAEDNGISYLKLPINGI